MLFRERELNFDIFDADTAERYETATQAVEDATAKVEGERLSASIRRQCEAVFAFFDALFGKGFHRELFGEKTNLIECLDAFAEFVSLAGAQQSAVNDRLSKYLPDRAGRRRK